MPDEPEHNHPGDPGPCAQIAAERDAFRKALEKAEADMHEIQAGDLSPYEAIDTIRAALSRGNET